MRPVCSTSGMNSRGRQQAVLGVLPAHERLDAASRAGRDLGLGLEVQHELAARDARRAARRAARGGRGCGRRAPRGRRDARVRLRLAWYIATSARWSSSTASSACSGKSAMPMLASTCTRMPSSTNGSSSARAGAPAMLAAASSPVAREHDGELVAAEARERVVGAQAWPPAAGRSAQDRSPAWWPSVSLSSLKPSRSTSSSAGRRGALAARCRRRARRTSARRLGSPVRSSVSAWRRVSPSWRTSRKVIVVRATESTMAAVARPRDPCSWPRAEVASTPTATSVETDGIASARHSPTAGVRVGQRLPCGERHDEEGGGPDGVEPACPGRRCRGGLDEVDRVGEAVAEHAEAEEHPRAARAPARQAEDADTVVISSRSPIG